MPSTKAVVAPSPKSKALAAPQHAPSSVSPTWERLPDESTQAYARFLRYRCTPQDERSYRKLGVALSLVQRWARRHRWTERVAAYDDYLFSLRDSLHEAASLTHRAKAARYADRTLDKATAIVDALNPAKVDGATAVLLARSASDLGRLALGLSDARSVQLAAGVSVGVGVVWGGEHPAWLPNSKQNENETGKRNNNEMVNSRVKVLANDTSAELGVHAPVPAGNEIVDAEIVTPKEKD